MRPAIDPQFWAETGSSLSSCTKQATSEEEAAVVPNVRDFAKVSCPEAMLLIVRDCLLCKIIFPAIA